MPPVWVASMISALVLARLMVHWALQRGVKSFPMGKWMVNANFDFIGKARIAVPASAVACIAGLRSPVGDAGAGSEGGTDDDGRVGRAELRLLGLAAGYWLLLPWAGFVPATILFLAAGARLLGERRLVHAVIVAVAASLGAWVELAALRVVVGRRIGPIRVGGAQRGRVLASAGVAGLVALGLRWSPLGELAPIPQALAVLVPAAAAYLAVAWVLRIDELRRFVAGRGATGPGTE